MRYLQDKITALWLSEEIINEVRANLLRVVDTHQGQRTLLNQEWEYKVSVRPTHNERIQKINVSVSKTDEPFFQLTSFLYAQ